MHGKNKRLLLILSIIVAVGFSISLQAPTANAFLEFLLGGAVARYSNSETSNSVNPNSCVEADLSEDLEERVAELGKVFMGFEIGPDKKKLSAEQAAGILSNFAVESHGGDPAAYQSDFADSPAYSRKTYTNDEMRKYEQQKIAEAKKKGEDLPGVGLGLAQWTPGSKLLDKADEMGEKWQSVKAQFAMLEEGLAGLGRFWDKGKTAKDYAFYFLADYEMPFGCHGDGTCDQYKVDERQKNADNFYEIIKKSALNPSKSISIGCDTSTPNISDKTLEAFVKFVMTESNWNEGTNDWAKGEKGIDLDGEPSYGIGSGPAQCADIGKHWADVWNGKAISDLSSGGALISGPDEDRATIPAPHDTLMTGLNRVKAGDILILDFGHVAVAITDEDVNGNYRVLEQNPQHPHISDVSTKGDIFGGGGKYIYKGWIYRSTAPKKDDSSTDTKSEEKK
jgi:hypothetical protein